MARVCSGCEPANEAKRLKTGLADVCHAARRQAALRQNLCSTNLGSAAVTGSSHFGRTLAHWCSRPRQTGAEPIWQSNAASGASPRYEKFRDGRVQTFLMQRRRRLAVDRCGNCCQRVDIKARKIGFLLQRTSKLALSITTEIHSLGSLECPPTLSRSSKSPRRIRPLCSARAPYCGSRTPTPIRTAGTLHNELLNDGFKACSRIPSLCRGRSGPAGRCRWTPNNYLAIHS